MTKAPEVEASPDPRTVFVVHGRNEALRRSLFDYLRSVGLLPIEWSAALALTGSATPYIGDVLDAAFRGASAVVVLLTPDEIAYLREDLSYQGEADAKPQMQARPNVLFEAGMAFGTHPDKTVLVQVGEVRAFSDVAGRHILRLGNDVASRQQLATRLRTAGCAVDADGTDWHTAGDFSAPEEPPAEVTPASQEEEEPKTREAREDLKFPLKFNGPFESAGSLTVRNDGDLPWAEVRVTIPATAALTFARAGSDKVVTIPEIPAKRSVTLRIERGREYSSVNESAFSLEVSGTRQDGAELHGRVFVDLNGFKDLR